jgi:hypothetical protein
MFPRETNVLQTKTGNTSYARSLCKELHRRNKSECSELKQEKKSGM